MNTFKFIVVILIAIINYNFSYSQNLVPNPGFEDISLGCPVYNSGVDSNFQSVLVDWFISAGSPDIFNTCNLGEVGVSNNFAGKQYPATGNGYGGIFSYVGYSNGYECYYREYFACRLKSPLVPNQKYYLSYKISLADSCNCASKNIDFLFSNDSVYLDICSPLANSSHFKLNNIITDTLNWISVRGSFIADSIYHYLMIGNFYVDSLTDTIFYPERQLGIYLDNHQGRCISYYYIDDICVSSDSTACDRTTDVQAISMPQELIISPNPVFDKVSISVNPENLSDNIRVEIFNSHGISISIFNLVNTQIDFSEFPIGIYYIKVHSNTDIITKKIVKL